MLINSKKSQWSGKNIRKLDGPKEPVSLPRKSSIISIPITTAPNQTLNVTVLAKKQSGNGLFGVRLVKAQSSPKWVTLAAKSDVQSLQAALTVQNVTQSVLQMFRPTDATGNVIIEEIFYSAEEIVVPSPPKTQPPQTAQVNARLGGSGGKWAGKEIKTIHKFHSECAVLHKPNSVISSYIHNLQPNKKYQVKITAAKYEPTKSCAIGVSFFGGLNCEGPQKTISVTSSTPKEHNLILQAPAFESEKIYLRIWRKPGGSTILKQVECKQIVTPKEPPPKKPAPPKLKPLLEVEMKYHPYNFNRASERVSEVTISSPDQVPKVSIITPTREGLVWLEKLWPALSKNTAYPNWEWVVGDSESKDGSVDYLKSLDDSRIKIIERGTTEGSFSTINNELVSQCDGELLVFLNNDIEPQPYWLYNMVQKIKAPEIGVVGSRLLYPNGHVQHCGILFSQDGPCNVGKALLKNFPKGYVEKDRYYQAVTAACLLVTREDFLAVGGFDKRLWFVYDDVDLCLRIGRLGKKVLYSASSVLIHHESQTQKVIKTGGEKQKAGIAYFKNTWMRGPHPVDFDLVRYIKQPQMNIRPIDISFITCISDVQKYNRCVVGSLFNTKSEKSYEIVPIINKGNIYSAAQALNLGMEKARGKLLVFAHQDVIFYNDWINLLFSRVKEIEQKKGKWGVLGTAGINEKDHTIGVVYNVKGRVDWQSTRKVRFGEVQTLDEHCIILKAGSGLRFDEKTCAGYHLYGADICLSAINKGLKVYGILAPLTHASGGGSLWSGRDVFMRDLRALAKKWGGRFNKIRTPTSVITNGRPKTFINFGN